MKIVIDMNLSPQAATQAESPSVIQLRTQDVSPLHIGKVVAASLQQFAEALEAGALVSIEEKRARARILPLFRQR